MFRPYQIKSPEIDLIVAGLDVVTFEIYKRKYNQFRSATNESIKGQIDTNRIVSSMANGSRLQELSFPSDSISDSFDVFISHSHQDEEKKKLVSNLALYLYGRYGIRCFIDSEYWSYCNNIIKDVNRKIGKHNEHVLANGRTLMTSDAEDLLYVSSNVYAMLSMAIMRMIDNIPCVIFIDSEESMSYEKNIDGKISEVTKSPWIYEEINYINSLKENCPSYYKEEIHEGMECFSERFKFNIDKGDFQILTKKELTNLTQNNKEQAMCDLFNVYEQLSYNQNMYRYL